MPGFDARHATRRSRRVRMVLALVVVLGLAAFLVVHFAVGSSPTSGPAPRKVPRTSAPPSVTSVLAAWRLTAPLSRAVVLAGDTGQLVILGGATTGGLEASGIFTVNVADGALAQIGDLAGETDDGAGAVIGGRDVVFGGATPGASAMVQEFPAPGATIPGPLSPGSPVPRSGVIATLPAPRAEATAVTVGATTFIVGGADGGVPDPAVLATTDGRIFTTVASLPVPVQFPAVAAAAGLIYVFGGMAVTGPDAGRPVDTIQVVDPTTHRATATGHLPEALTGAAAVTLDGHILVAGGDPASAVSAPGAATTVASATTSAPGASGTGPTVSTVWVFDPHSGKCVAVGHLPVAVSHAGLAVVGATAWLVGGESDAAAVSATQTLVVSSPAARPAG